MKFVVTSVITLVIGYLACLPFINGAFRDRIEIRLNAPISTTSTDRIHIVGSFNDWQVAGKEAVQLMRTGNEYVATIPKTHEPVFYTFLKNQSWQHGPAQPYGKGMCTFAYNPNDDVRIIQATVSAWGGDEPSEELTSSLVGNIEVLKDVEMPQLQRKRDVWVYLPPSYASELDKQFPVLYMLDGQNVFDRKTSYSGEWQVDESLQRLFNVNEVPEFIVVAVDNGPKRMSEYSPWTFKYGDNVFEAEGEETMLFITQTLKPMIDQSYRTLPEQSATGIAGASLGGMMAIYAAIEYADIFGFVGAFSPSLSIENEQSDNVLFTALEQTDKIENVIVYTDMGLAEYGDYKKMDAFTELLSRKVSNQANLHIVKDDLGRHCEASWAERFPNAIKLFVNE